MGFLDWFRPRIRHSDHRVRRKALSSIDDVAQLRRLARLDPHENVRAAALQWFDDPAFMSAVAQEDPHERVRLTALKRVDDLEVIAAIARTDLNAAVRQKAVQRITDVEVLAGISEEDKNRDIRDLALHRIKDEGVLARIARKSAHAHCREWSAKNVADPAVHEELAVSDPDPGVRAMAVRQLTSIDVLRKVVADDTDKKVLKVARARLRKGLPLPLMLKVKVDCNQCSRPVILNGPVLRKRCESCHGEVGLSEKFWKKLIRLHLLPRGLLSTGLQGLSNIDIDAGIVATCPSCEGTIELDGEGGRCEKCGQRAPLQPLPEFLAGVSCGSSAFQRRKPLGLLLATLEPDVDAPEQGPILFHCPNCSGNLRLTQDMPRTILCTHCETNQYLPDGLWISMHPAEKKRAWYVYFGSALGPRKHRAR